MTTNTNSPYYVPTSRLEGDPFWPILDSSDNDKVICRVKTKKQALQMIDRMNEAEPPTERDLRNDALSQEAKPDARTAHKGCEHPTSKLARAICRRERAKAAAATEEAEAEDLVDA